LQWFACRFLFFFSGSNFYFLARDHVNLYFVFLSSEVFCETRYHILSFSLILLFVVVLLISGLFLFLFALVLLILILLLLLYDLPTLLLSARLVLLFFSF
jgi:hypothetical protein